jgi:TonB family protein
MAAGRRYAMFEHVLVTNTGRTVRPYTMMAGLAGQMALVSLGVLLPLVYTDRIPSGWAARIFEPLPPPGRFVQEAVKPVNLTTTDRPAATQPAKFYEPVRYPEKAAIIVDPPSPVTGGFESPGVPGGIGPSTAPLPKLLQEAMKTILVPAPPVKAAPAAPIRETVPRVRVGGLVKPPAPLYTPKPAYPVLAQRARVEGVVHLETVIATDGTVKSIRLIGGHALLAQAAIAAVREWRYTPPTLNGEPVEMEMVVDVHFTLAR